MERGSDDGIIGQLHSATLYATFVGIVPELHYWFQRILETLRPYGFNSSRAEVLDFVDFHIGQRRKGITPNDKNDFLTKLLQLEEDGANSRGDTQISCRSNIAAGSDTTAISMSAILYYLLQNPDVMAKLRNEIDRMAVEGKFLPENTEVGINPWVAHQNDKVFPKPTDFWPERWLGSKEEVTRMDSYFASFGFGSRTCIGRHISFLEMNKLIPQLIRKYEFELDPPNTEWTIKSYFFAKQRFCCKIKSR
ncbi:hypothetical protein BBP40_010620 [Aspergillus hancockii]|nr:hypothetical protein BBP40_010620 [Aspergillus hancockii]